MPTSDNNEEKINNKKIDRKSYPEKFDENLSLSQKFNIHLGKIGIVIMVVGLFILYYDAYELNQTFPINYHFYEHPKVYVPIIGMFVSFFGTSIFMINFRKGRNVI